MKKLFLYILFLFIFLLPAPAEAEDNVENKEINPTDIPKLTIDPTKEVPAYMLVPKPTPTPRQKEPEKEADSRAWTTFEYSNLIKKTAEKYDLDPQVIYATIMTESEGNPYAFRYEPGIKDASLCMGQILISTARNLGFMGPVKELYKPDVCIDLIGKYHRNMLDTYGELTPRQLATAYNAGSPYKRAVAGHIWRFMLWYNGENPNLIASR